MSVRIPLEPSETILFHDTFIGERQSFPFVFAASRRAIYVSREKHLAIENWCYERLPLEQVKRVVLRRERPVWLILGAVVLFAFGASLAYLEWSAANMSATGYRTIHVLPYFLMIFAAAMPFLGRRRKSLVIEKKRGRFKWTPKLQFAGANRDEIESIQTRILAACASIGLSVAED